MLCPQCREPLIIVECEGTEVDVCYDGHGIWFDAQELRQLFELVGAPEGLHDLEERLERLEAVEPGTDRPCPRCEHNMMQVDAPGPSEQVILDRCEKGHGLWFDDGELDAVLATELEEGGPLDAVRDHLGRFLAPEKETD